MTNTGTDTIDNQSTERILHIRYRSGDDDRLIEALDALDQGETPEPVFEVVYHNIEDLHQVTRPTNLELLRTIVRQEPSSIRETARMVDRDVRQVHRNLTELEKLGLIDLDQDGRSKRPSTWYDAIEVDLPLGESGSTYDTADA